MRAVSEAQCFLCPPDGLSGRDQPVELLTPARVNHMPSTGKSARLAWGCSGSPEGLFGGPSALRGLEGTGGPPDRLTPVPFSWVK